MMRKKTSRRKAMTLIELLVVLVLLALFIYMAFHLFSVTFDIYNFNRKMAAQMYAQVNADNFFEMFERELMYAGSMGSVINKLDGFKDESIIIEDATVTVQYALGEQLILTKKDKASYGRITPKPANFEFTYFPLYPAGLPDSLDNRWSLAYDDIATTSDVTVLEISSINNSDVDVSTSQGPKTARMFEIVPADPGVTNPATYVSILLDEKAFDSLGDLKIRLGDSKEWAGEMIYQAKIFKDASDLKIRKYIPTINSSYTLTLIQDVDVFEATELTGQNLYIATLTYLIPDIKPATVTVTRKFLKTQ